MLYAHLHRGWGLFASLFLAPDLTFIAFAAGPRVGAIAYNTLHSYLGPVLLSAASLRHPALAPFALIWAAHIGFDRALGYSLKYSTGFQHTHLRGVRLTSG